MKRKKISGILVILCNVTTGSKYEINMYGGWNYEPKQIKYMFSRYIFDGGVISCL